ncbi:MAG TPA: hypothetical protein VF610_00445, partial [Segetibacter sp.]
NWSDEANAAGYKGTSFARGVAGHGSLSPYDVHIALLASGPSFKTAYKSDLPTSNVDITPTILHIHRLPVPPTMEGRVMYELLNDKNNPPALRPKQEVVEATVNYPGGSYRLQLNRTILGKYKYVNFSRITRSKVGAE